MKRTLHRVQRLQYRGQDLFCTYFSNFVETQLTCKDYSLCTEIVKFTCSNVIHYACLGRNMDFHIGSVLFYEHEQSDVRNDKSVHLSFNSFTYELFKGRDFVVAWEGISTDRPLFLGMSTFNSRNELFEVEIHRRSTHTEAFPSEVDCIRTEIQCGMEAFLVICGSKNFKFIHY